MNIPDSEYSKEEFKEYLIDHSDEIFSDDVRRKWLKIYCVLSDENWKKNLFHEKEITRLGEIYRITPTRDTDDEADEFGEKVTSNDIEEEVYYLEEYVPGLLLIYTTANKEQYNKDLGKRIRKSIGTYQMWMKPDIFKEYWRGIIEETKGHVYYFTSRRSVKDTKNCQIRPYYNRRLNYTGEDATQTLEELEELYGVIPVSVYIKITHGLKIHITNEGLFSAQKPSSKALNIFFHHLEKIISKIMDISNTTKSFKYNVVEIDTNFKLASFAIGEIQLERELDEVIASQISDYFDGFSFIDTHIEKGSLSFTATVYDEKKGSVFNISASESRILMIPKFRYTFESFIDFYRNVVEIIDDEARISLHNKE